MSRFEKTTSTPAGASCQVVVNFSDDATVWFRELNAAAAARPAEIEVQFVGGCAAPPHEIIALRNALLRLPASIRLVTTALVSLPPMTGVAWLAGDERRIAKDAVLWIPELPEDILRGGARRSGQACGGASNGKGDQADFATIGEEAESEGENDDTARQGRPRGVMGKRRIERDLRALADSLNEWFPSWEFKGGCLNFDDLVVWGVVEPEWCFGGRGVRGRDRAPQKKRSRARKTTGKGALLGGPDSNSGGGVRPADLPESKMPLSSGASLEAPDAATSETQPVTRPTDL